MPRLNVTVTHHRKDSLMANLGYFLKAPGYIQSQNVDYLQSQNNNFFAIVQDDGNFCVCKGTPSNH